MKEPSGPTGEREEHWARVYALVLVYTASILALIWAFPRAFD